VSLGSSQSKPIKNPPNSRWRPTKCTHVKPGGTVTTGGPWFFYFLNLFLYYRTIWKFRKLGEYFSKRLAKLVDFTETSIKNKTREINFSKISPIYLGFKIKDKIRRNFHYCQCAATGWSGSQRLRIEGRGQT
jgi:hypothetical protein